MNIAKLLLDEIQRVARQRASEKYNDPRAKDITLSLSDVIQIDVAKSNIPRMFQLPHMIFDSKYPSYSERLEADSFYTRVATLMEYNEICVSIDNTLAYIMEEWNTSKEKHGKGKLPPQYRNLWKYYIPLSQSVASKQEKQDCLRYALLRTLDENDQMLTFGIVWRPDASISKIYDSKLKSMTREERNVERLRQEQLSRNSTSSWEVDNGKVRSSYVMAYCGDES